MKKIKVRIIRDYREAFNALCNADIAVLASIVISEDGGESVEICSCYLFSTSTEITQILSQVECVKSTEPLHKTSDITVFYTGIIGTNDLLKSLKEVFGDLEISVLQQQRVLEQYSV